MKPNKEWSAEDAIKRFQQVRIIDGHEIILPPPPAKTAIPNWNKPVLRQKFQREEFPTEIGFKNFPVKEQKKLFQYWFDCRYHGYWFFNCGELEYITGHHWTYLNCYFGDSGLPNYVDSDRDFFYVWDKAEKLSTCTGMIYATSRRDGKTQKALTIALNISTWRFQANVGFQGNVDKDGEKLLVKYVTAWQQAPFFMKPAHDSGSTRPKEKVSFFAPSSRSLNKAKATSSIDLKNTVDFRASVDTAYDGSKLAFKYDDEVGKAPRGVNVNKRYDIGRECLMRGKRVIGKYMLTSTIEPEEDEFGQSKGIDSWSITNFRKLWTRSQADQINEEGFTDSGLIAYFKPAYRGFEGFVDEYGNSDEAGARKFIENMRAGKQGEDLLAYIRKYPFTVEEFFSAEDRASDLDIQKIEDQVKWNDLNVDKPNGEIKKVKGDFHWATNYGGDVMWIPNENGRFEVCWHPPADKINKKHIRDGRPIPANINMGVIGSDSIDHSFKKGSTRSMYAAVGMVFAEGAPFATEAYQNGVMLTYCCRLNDPNAQHEDMLKAAMYYGVQVHFEYMRVGAINYFKERGFEGYLTKRPKNLLFNTRYARSTDYGTPTQDQKVRGALMEYIVRYISTNCGYGEHGMGNIYYTEILMQVKNMFADKEWTKYDLAVAFMMALGIYYSDRKKAKTYDASAVSGIMDFKTY